MPNTNLRNIGWWTLIILGVVIGGLAVDALPNWLLPRVKSVEEAERNVREGLVAGHAERFEVIEVSVEQCEIRMFADDTDLCGDYGRIRSKQRYVDLQAYELIEPSYYEPRPNSKGWTQLFRLKARPGSSDRVETIQRRSEHLLAQARKEVGRGPKAAVLSSERLLMEFPLANLSKWQRVKNCSGHTWVSPDDLYGLSFNSSNLDLLRASLRKLNKTCGELD